MGLTRSYLYVPGNAADKLAKAHSRGSDALIVDLEDAVRPERKEAARAELAELLAAPGGARRFVRVNDPATELGLTDPGVLLQL